MKYAGESETLFDKEKKMKKVIKALQWEKQDPSALKECDFAEAWSKPGRSFKENSSEAQTKSIHFFL